jgi:enamine deaminase RidA (YjgF/YER057c/UK114 family)
LGSSFLLFGAQRLLQPKMNKFNFSIPRLPPLQSYHSAKRYELETCCTCRAPSASCPGKRELAPGGIEPETKQVMDNIGEVLKVNGLTFDDVFKCTVMLAHMFNWGAFNKIYVTYFKPERLPARSAFGANGLVLDAEVELECWAYARK